MAPKRQEISQIIKDIYDFFLNIALRTGLSDISIAEWKAWHTALLQLFLPWMPYFSFSELCFSHWTVVPSVMLMTLHYWSIVGTCYEWYSKLYVIVNRSGSSVVPCHPRWSVITVAHSSTGHCAVLVMTWNVLSTECHRCDCSSVKSSSESKPPVSGGAMSTRHHDPRHGGWYICCWQAQCCCDLDSVSWYGVYIHETTSANESAGWEVQMRSQAIHSC